MCWRDPGTEVAVLHSQVVPISQVVLKTGFTFFIHGSQTAPQIHFGALMAVAVSLGTFSIQVIRVAGNVHLVTLASKGEWKYPKLHWSPCVQISKNAVNSHRCSFGHLGSNMPTGHQHSRRPFGEETSMLLTNVNRLQWDPMCQRQAFYWGTKQEPAWVGQLFGLCVSHQVLRPWFATLSALQNTLSWHIKGIKDRPAREKNHCALEYIERRRQNTSFSS